MLSEREFNGEADDLKTLDCNRYESVFMLYHFSGKQRFIYLSFGRGRKFLWVRCKKYDCQAQKGNPDVWS
jgi:hypothetical protein